MFLHTSTAKMIIRDISVRQARRALAQTASSSSSSTSSRCIRALSTDASSSTPSTTSSSSSSQPPSLFIRTAKPINKNKSKGPDNTAVEFGKAQVLKKYIGKAGAVVQKTYHPDDIFRNPPGPADISLELLMSAQAHMGHNTSLWNPANARYIFGIREGIHIISLEQTAAHLRRAASIVDGVAYGGGNILFVGTRPGQTRMVVQAAKMSKSYHLFNKWKAGSITNSDVLLRGLPVAMIDEFDEPIQGVDYHSIKTQPVKPDLVVCLNPLENYVLLHECALSNIPTIGIVDTNTEPTWVTYPIPANDDSLRCSGTIASILGRAGQQGHERRLAAAKKGYVTWETPDVIHRHMTDVAIRAAEAAQKAATQAKLLAEAAALGSSNPEGLKSEDMLVDENSEASQRQKKLMEEMDEFDKDAS